MNTEHFDLYDANYVNALKSAHRRYKIRLELLDRAETVIGEITKDLSLTAQGQLTINNEQLTRRSVSLTMINVAKKYLPSPDNPFWLGRKFKLWIGIVGNNDISKLTTCKAGDIYWWSCGVFYTQTATSDNGIVSITGIDKGGALDGTLNTGRTTARTITKSGSSIATLVRDTLLLPNSDMAGARPIDPISPVIDITYYTKTTQSDIEISGDEYLGELLKTIADGYGADIYYNTNGHLTLKQASDAIRVEGFNYMAHQWEFSDADSYYCASNLTYSFDGFNVVTVYTNATSGGLVNASYTARNNNPLSPMRISLVGERRMEEQTIPYTGTTTEEMERICKDHAKHLLIKQSMIGMTATFNSPIIPHFDVGKTIGITDKRRNLDHDTFVVQSVTMALGAGEMSVSASNASWLPNDKVTWID